ncbi:MAG TPA: DJ-1/PfpI family protein [Mycobacteriales bacterium]|jgi:putative intracellular protease/amidase|nr:DJ-1/PfpI family protein [Mycobacteriales bacterium]
MNPKTVHVVLCNEWADWEIGPAMARINAPIWQREPGRFATATVAETRQPRRSMGGLTAVPDLTVAEIRPADSAMLIIPGGAGWECADWDRDGYPAITALAEEFLDAGVPVAAICGATFGLARAGLLDDRDHTSGAPEYLAMSGYRGAARYRDERAVTDGDLITAGPTDALEFTRHILARLEILTAEALEAWYQLFSTGDAAWYGVLNAATTADPVAAGR